MLQQLYTPQGEMLQGDPWQVYPRPQMRRDTYVNLNGAWDFTVSESPTPPQAYTKRIQVPFCPESLLSGIHRHFPEGSYLWYRKQWVLPETVSGKVLLHIGAADQELTCYVNGQQAGHHIGGYTAMTFDITAYLQPENTLELCCRDDLTDQRHPYGKQTMRRGGMWYTPVSGIWQTVWLEWVPEIYIQKLTVQNRDYSVTISIDPPLTGSVNIPELGSFSLENGQVTITAKNPRLWSPEDPYLYDFTVQTETDRVESYFAIRKLSVETWGKHQRLCLNGKPYFFHGLLDQGYWPDGIYTPATPDCYAQDILSMKKLGFNTLRKHIKVEPEEFYYQCDRLGMVVFQDMVNNADYSFLRDTALPTLGLKIRDKNMHSNPETRQSFLGNMTATVRQLENHPSIVYWTIFNEAWGQFHSDAVYEALKKLDDSRFIDSTSGWYHQQRTDVRSLHIYFGTWGILKSRGKPLVLSEFGGHAHKVEGHVYNPDKVFGYKICKTPEKLQVSVEALYRKHILPAIKDGLCAAIYTQVSDVEDEINGILTYDRKVCKVDVSTMKQLAEELTQAING